MQPHSSLVGHNKCQINSNIQINNYIPSCIQKDSLSLLFYIHNKYKKYIEHLKIFHSSDILFFIEILRCLCSPKLFVSA